MGKIELNLEKVLDPPNFEEEDLGFGIKYRSNFNPSDLRQSIGLDGGTIDMNMSLIKKTKIANTLWRHGYLSKEEVVQLGGWFVRDPDYHPDPTVTSYDFPPSSHNRHLQR